MVFAVKDTSQSPAKAGSASQLVAKQRTNLYEKTVIDFVTKDKGCFIVVSEDPAFLSVLRTVLYKHLGLVASSALVTVHEVNNILKAVKEADSEKKRPFIFIERKFNGQDMAFMIKQFKAAFPTALILVLTVEVERYRIVYLHEMGADNFIAKPVSAQTIIEKMAFTIKPQDELGTLIEKAKSLLRQGEPKAAKEVAQKILTVKKGSSAALMIVGDAEIALGDMEAAKRAYQEASDNTALYLEPLRKLADLAEKTGDMEGCLEYLERLDRLSPLNSERKVSMGEINLNLGNDAKAHELFDQAMRQLTKEAMGQILTLAERVAEIYADKNPERSAEFLRRALDVADKHLSREDIRIFNRLGISLRRQGKWQEAVDEYNKALKLVPDDAGLHYNRSMAYMEGGAFSDAWKSMALSLKCDPRLPYSSPDVAYNMGVAFLKGGVRDKARQCFEIALELKPDMPKAKEALSKL